MCGRLKNKHFTAVNVFNGLIELLNWKGHFETLLSQIIVTWRICLFSHCGQQKPLMESVNSSDDHYDVLYITKLDSWSEWSILEKLILNVNHSSILWSQGKHFTTYFSQASVTSRLGFRSWPRSDVDCNRFRHQSSLESELVRTLVFWQQLKRAKIARTATVESQQLKQAKLIELPASLLVNQHYPYK